MRKLRHPWRPGGALVLVLVVLAIAGCGPATTPTTQPAAPAAPPPASAPSAAAAPPAAQSDWQRDWEQTLAAARREGKVVVNGSASATYRGPLTAFNQDYPDIQLDFSSMPAPQFWERVQRERAAEQYLWDVNVYGVELQMFQARDSGLLDPVRPLLVLPEVAGDANWLGGVDNLFFYE